ncbi:macrophage mannose receptor 1, partial [Silurus meridionalis]
NWIDAQHHCRQNYTDLAIIITSNESLRIYDVRGDAPYWSMSWIGLYRTAPGSDTWMWTNKESTKVLNWGINQPDNSGGNENCGVLYAGGWNDIDCSFKLPVICYRNL